MVDSKWNPVYRIGKNHPVLEHLLYEKDVITQYFYSSNLAPYDFCKKRDKELEETFCGNYWSTEVLNCMFDKNNQLQNSMIQRIV